MMLIKFRFSSYNIIEAVKLVKASAKAKFDETLDFQLRLNVDPKHGDQAVRGNCLMPGGLGKKIVLAVFTQDNLNDACQRAGADIVGAELLVQQLNAGTYKFDKLIATNDMIPVLKQYARVLGPKGLMPNLKAGTLVTQDKLIESIKGAKAGSIEFRVDSGKNLMVPVGKVSFEDEQILRNIKAFAIALNDKKPATIKGGLINCARLKSTMGKPVDVDIQSFDMRVRENALANIVV